MANPWFRMYAEFANDPKVQMLSEADQRRYIMLLCMRCSNGDVTLHDDEVAFQLRISNEQWADTKQTLLRKNLITEDNQPTAWEKRQYVSDSSAKRVAAHRAKKKQECNVTVTPPDTDTDTDTDTDNNSPTGRVADKPATPKPSLEIPYEQIRQLYNDSLGSVLPRRMGLNDSDRKRIAACYNLKLEGTRPFREHGMKFWEQLFADVLDTPFMCGQNARGWRADFEFLTTSTKVQRFLEGKYDDAA